MAQNTPKLHICSRKLIVLEQRPHEPLRALCENCGWSTYLDHYKNGETIVVGEEVTNG